jgi:hypothetical protein
MDDYATGKKIGSAGLVQSHLQVENPAGSAVPMATALAGALVAGLVVRALLVRALFVGAATAMAGPARPTPAARSVHLREFVDFQITHEDTPCCFLILKRDPQRGAARSWPLRQNSSHANRRLSLT